MLFARHKTVVFILACYFWYDNAECEPVTMCWSGNLVPFKIRSDFTANQTQYILQRIAEIVKKTCVRWINMDENRNLRTVLMYVQFEPAKEGDCHAVHRYSPPRLTLFIRLPEKCFREALVLHELVHALGFYHEHQRSDRDCYVVVDQKAVRSNSNFDKIYQPTLERFPYDKRSIMHYRRSQLMRSASENIVLEDPMGNNEERLTDLDVWKIEYKFCNRPHYCTVHPAECEQNSKFEQEGNC